MELVSVATSENKIMTNSRIRGRIKGLKRNYGFIGGIDSKDYFFHWTALSTNTKTFNQLTIGTTVEFIPDYSNDKNKATDIVAID